MLQSNCPIQLILFLFLSLFFQPSDTLEHGKKKIKMLSLFCLFSKFFWCFTFFFFFPKFCDLLDYACAPEILASKKHTTFFPATTNVNNAADKSFWLSATPITYRTTVCSVMFQESIWGLKHLANSSDVWKVKVSLELHFITPLTQFVMALT